MTMSVNELMERFDKANALRVRGLSAVAIEEFTEVLRVAGRTTDAKARSKVYATRGAAKLALGFQSVQKVQEGTFAVRDLTDDEALSRGAIEDLTVAVTLDEDNGWAWAQLGEAHRTFARDHFRVMPQARFHAHTQEALAAFTKAEAVFTKTPGHLSRYDYWLLGHKAATNFLIVWHKWDIDNFSHKDPFQTAPASQEIRDAQDGFESAIAKQPGYAWAMRFYAFLLTCQGKYPEAHAWLTTASQNEPTTKIKDSAYPHVKRSMAMLHRYRAQRLPLASQERHGALKAALEESQKVMTYDSDDFYALYAYAAATADLQTADADAICLEARDGILNQVMRGILMAFALHRKGKSNRGYAEVLFETFMTAGRDPEMVTIATHDPAWATGQEGSSRDLLRQFQAEWSNYFQACGFSFQPQDDEKKS